ncbi:MAG TPA: DUF916 domain-containing protein [Candidatus Saccharimonadales bacterium]|nr:DUF916 domain-containing protein [Candidatus Saccharimonadales bacterium]
MARRRISTAVVVVMLAVSTLVTTAWRGNAYAAQTSVVGGNALKVSPVRQDIIMDPGTTKTVSVFITNISSVPANLHMAINDFVATGDESGRPSVILDENQYAPSHSFKRFAVPVKDFTLAGNASKEIDVQVTVPKSAAGGGYYGAIRFQPLGSNGSKNLNLSASVGSLVLLRVNGNIVEQMHIASFDVRRGDNSAVFFTTGKGLTNVVRFQNTGNVQLEPFGKMILKRFGKQIASYEVNSVTPRGSVLPDSIRRFDTKLADVGSFGKYTLQGNFGYGSTGQLLSSSVTFYVLPVPLVIGAFAGLVALLLLIFVLPRLIRAYNRRVIRRASRRR